MPTKSIDIDIAVMTTTGGEKVTMYLDRVGLHYRGKLLHLGAIIDSWHGDIALEWFDDEQAS